MARKARRPAVDYAVYVVIRCAVAVLQAIPLRLAFQGADALAWLAYRVDKRHREVARDNLTHAFPEKSNAEIDALVRSCYRHCIRIVVEIALLPRKMRLSNWRTYGQLTNADGMVHSLLDGDRATMLVLGHFGNWELAGFATGAFGMKSYAIARVLDNPHLERFFKEFRTATGQTIIAKNDDFPRLEAALRLGGTVATLADQDAGPRGVFVNFFGRPASAHKAVALMALEFNCRLVVMGVPRLSQFGIRNSEFGMKTKTPSDTKTETGAPQAMTRSDSAFRIPHSAFFYELVCEDIIEPAEYDGRPDAVQAITQRYHAALERLIRRHPEQYFWLHRRWKSVPAVKKSTMKLAKAA